MSSGLPGVLPRLRGVVPVGANDFSTGGTRWPVASKSAADMTGDDPAFCWNAPSSRVFSLSAMSPDGGVPGHPASGDHVDWLILIVEGALNAAWGLAVWLTPIRTRCGSSASTCTATIWPAWTVVPSTH